VCLHEVGRHTPSRGTERRVPGQAPVLVLRVAPLPSQDGRLFQRLRSSVMCHSYSGRRPAIRQHKVRKW